MVCSSPNTTFSEMHHKLILSYFSVAVQCNLFGEPYAYITSEAPDPRDILWNNMSCEHRFIEKRKILVEFVLVILGGCSHAQVSLHFEESTSPIFFKLNIFCSLNMGRFRSNNHQCCKHNNRWSESLWSRLGKS